MLLFFSFTFLLLFNTRSEGPSNVYLGPIYGILFWNLLRFSRESTAAGIKVLVWSIFILTVFVMSFSLTDLGKLLGVNKLVWIYNLRTPFVALLFLVSFASLFSQPLRRLLYAETPTPKPL